MQGMRKNKKRERRCRLSLSGQNIGAQNIEAIRINGRCHYQQGEKYERRKTGVVGGQVLIFEKI